MVLFVSVVKNEVKSKEVLGNELHKTALNRVLLASSLTYDSYIDGIM